MSNPLEALREFEDGAKPLYSCLWYCYDEYTGKTWHFSPVSHLLGFYPYLDQSKFSALEDAAIKVGMHAIEHLRKWKTNPDMPAEVRNDAHALLTYGPFQFLKSKFQPKLKLWEGQPATTRNAFQPTRLVRHREHRATTATSRSAQTASDSPGGSQESGDPDPGSDPDSPTSNSRIERLTPRCGVCDHSRQFLRPKLISKPTQEEMPCAHQRISTRRDQQERITCNYNLKLFILQILCTIITLFIKEDKIKMNMQTDDKLYFEDEPAPARKTPLSRKPRANYKNANEDMANEPRQRTRKRGRPSREKMLKDRANVAALLETTIPEPIQAEPVENLNQQMVVPAEPMDNSDMVAAAETGDEKAETSESRSLPVEDEEELTTEDDEEAGMGEKKDGQSEPRLSEEELHDLVHQIGTSDPPIVLTRKIAIVLRGLVPQDAVIKERILAELSHLGLAMASMKKALAQFENEDFVARIIHSTPDRDEQLRAVAIGILGRFNIWSLSLLSGG